jgi:SCY1-like protein 2
MAEPLEETRSSLVFATEPVSSSLRHAISASDAAAAGRARRNGGEEDEGVLDEVEVQKGFTQLGKGLQFLHESAKLVHGNLTPEAVIINAKVRPCPQFSQGSADDEGHAGRLEALRLRTRSVPLLA